MADFVRTAPHRSDMDSDTGTTHGWGDYLPPPDSRSGRYAPVTGELLERVLLGLERLAVRREARVSAVVVPALAEGVTSKWCGVCAALIAQRDAARAAGDDWTARDRERELGNCPHRRATDLRPEVKE
jgi:hypothetical protein